MVLVPAKQQALIPSKQLSLIPTKQLVSQVLWDPTQFGSALPVWWDPTQGLTMNGSTVSSWVDRVGGLAATQSTASQQPGLTTRNGKQRLLFSGGQTLAFNPGATFPRGTTQTTLAISAYSAITGSGQPFMIGVGGQNGGIRGVYQLPAGDLAAGSGGGDYDSTVSWSTADLFSVTNFGASNVTLRVNGAQTAQVANKYNPTSDTSSNANIGFWTLYGVKWNGDIGHILAMNRPSDSFRKPEARRLGKLDGRQGGREPTVFPPLQVPRALR